MVGARRQHPQPRCSGATRLAASTSVAGDAEVRRRAVVALLVAGVLAPVSCNAQGSTAAADQRAPGGKGADDDKVRRASSGKNVLRDDFCPDPKPGQAILMNCQKAKLKRAKLAKDASSAAKSEAARKTGK